MFAKAVAVDGILVASAERADVVVDFSRFAGQRLQLKNQPLPNPYSSPAPRLGDVMLFNVATSVSDDTNNMMPAAGAPLIGGEFASVGAPTVAPRTITLNEWNAGQPHWYLTLTGRGGGGLTISPGGHSGGNCFADAISELPPEGAIQDWDFVNATEDTHPIHVHLVHFQVVHRRPNGAAVPADGTGVLAQEKGWKDTVAVHPGSTTRVRMKFDLPPSAPIQPPSGFVPGGTSPNYKLSKGAAQRTYIFHCHILEHEDNDMMRPFTVS
jgi:spore coat protein A